MENAKKKNGTTARSSDTRTTEVRRMVTLRGVAPVMFDRYPGDNNTKLLWHQKVYLASGGVIALPTLNIVSLLSSHNTNSAPKRLRDARKFKAIANSCLSFVVIGAPDGTDMIPFLRNGEPIVMGLPGESLDEQSGLYLHRAVARLDKGIPNPKERPTLPLPWSIQFSLTILPNQEIREQEVRNLIQDAGAAIGIGTFRGVFGKYVIDQWE